MKVLITDDISQEGIDILRSHAQVDVKLGIKLPELLNTIGDYEALVVRSQTQVTKEVIAAGEKLQVIARAGTGVDNIDLEEATRRGIIVVNAPTANTVSAAEHTIALLLALARNIPQANAVLKTGVWKRHEFQGIEVRGKTLGIIGLGKVGSEVAKRARGLEMRVIAHDPFISVDYARNLQVELVAQEQLFKESDFITLHLPLTAATKGLIGTKQLALVKPTVRIINCSRGGLIDEAALVKALKGKRVAGAAIDVFPKEPTTESPFFALNNAIVTPHLGASTTEAQATAAIDAANQIVDLINGRPAKYAVNIPFISVEAMSVLAPFTRAASAAGKLINQLAEGQMNALMIKYEGEIANYDTNLLKANILGGLLEGVSEERVNLVNANVIAAQRGLNVVEQKEAVCENYASLITAEATTNTGTTTVATTIMRKETHIVRVNNYWLDIVPPEGYLLFIDHRERPGIMGKVGKITGDADINISSMYVSRLKPRGQALAVLALDEALGEEHRQQILAIPEIYSAKVVKL